MSTYGHAHMSKYAIEIGRILLQSDKLMTPEDVEKARRFLENQKAAILHGAGTDEILKIAYKPK